jgi:hypothetical protein
MSPADHPRDADRITKQDIEAKFREIKGDIEETAESARGMAITVGAVVAVALVLGVFVLGKRRGKKKTTFIEVRRI